MKIEIHLSLGWKALATLIIILSLVFPFSVSLKQNLRIIFLSLIIQWKILQPNQINMALVFWYLAKSDSNVRYDIAGYKSRFTRYQTSRPCLNGHPVDQQNNLENIWLQHKMNWLRAFRFIFILLLQILCEDDIWTITAWYHWMALWMGL